MSDTFSPATVAATIDKAITEHRIALTAGANSWFHVFELFVALCYYKPGYVIVLPDGATLPT
jgi:hypothetical protein